ncbi:DUF3099 domain-containing protein [Glycomyces sp. NPDC046736]|uniref:DUF3099 domain-containing protein n=1 Tax=Glycomyces sp. NPDC046736 TaxID=3155615 RepID=UPI0033E62231
MGRREKTTVITDASLSLEEERRFRTIRYVLMMSIRGALVIVCGILVMNDVPYLLLWLAIGVVGMAALPWLAVLLANDRVVRRQGGSFFHRQRKAPVLETPTRPMIDSE